MGFYKPSSVNEIGKGPDINPSGNKEWRNVRGFEQQNMYGYFCSYLVEHFKLCFVCLEFLKFKTFHKE
jgi:hypothetical protein